MFRKAFVMSVHPDQHAEYARRHAPIWDELAETLRHHGVSNYSIFLHPGTHQLFAYVEVQDESRWNAIAHTEVCRRWWQYMRDVMPTNDDGSPVSQPLAEVFHLD
ncbi:MAG: L-rhamnose mutarotase [Fimbriimonadaceae bacterium]|nr:L-rhamnose mutarotase [Fimbriimonadaceae bacterium]